MIQGGHDPQQASPSDRQLRSVSCNRSAASMLRAYRVCVFSDFDSPAGSNQSIGTRLAGGFGEMAFRSSLLASLGFHLLFVVSSCSGHLQSTPYKVFLLRSRK